jgi:hypothetical protein
MKTHQKYAVYFSVLILFVVLGYVGWGKVANTFFYQEKAEHWRKLPLPELSSSVVLRIVYAENPRFKSLTEQQINQIIIKTAQLALTHFSVQVKFEHKKSISIKELFSGLPYTATKYQSDKILTINTEQQVLVIFDKIRKSISQNVQYGMHSVQSQIDYASPFLIESNKTVTNLDELTTALTKTLIQRHRVWLQQLANDGEPVLNGTPYNQWLFWDILGYGKLPYDVIITNQIVASIEENGMPVHTSLRGGISGGNMTYSEQGRLRGYVFVSAFQLMNNNPLLSVLRKDEAYSERQIIDYTAATITHELGHLLFHYAHPFNAQSCVMNPTPLLLYRQWYEQLDAEACRRLNPPMQQPGAARVSYNAKW